MSSSPSPSPESDFDMYILALTWSPRFCCTNEKQCKTESMDHRNDLHPHGLWPAYLHSSSYPSYCGGNFDGKHLTPRQRHEYEKHGSCSHLSVGEYFNQEKAVQDKGNILTLRDLLQKHAGNMIELNKLMLYGGNKKFAVLTSKQCQLQEISTCWEKRPDNTVGEQIDCPPHIMKGGRNTGAQMGCNKIFLDKADSTCSIISNYLLEEMKKKT